MKPDHYEIFYLTGSFAVHNHSPQASEAIWQDKYLGLQTGTGFILLFGVNKFKDILFVPGES